MKLHINLGEILKEKGITQTELVKMTGLRAAVISEMVNNQRTTINKEHIIKICIALDIKEIQDFMGFIE